MATTEGWARTIPRRLYATLSVEDGPGVLYELASLDSQVFCQPSSTLKVKLFAKRNSHEDLLIAQAPVQLGSHSDGTEFDAPSVESGLRESPVLVFKITVSNRFTDNSDVTAMRASLDVNPKLIKAFADRRWNHDFGAVMGLVEIGRSRFERFIARKESVLQLVEVVGRASVLVADWDDPELDEKRPNQHRVSQALFSAIYQSLHLLWTLSEDNLAERLSDKSVEAIRLRREELATLAERMKSNQQLDTQAQFFSISVEVAGLHDHNIINSLRSAQDAGVSTSKVCLRDTRVAILSRIRSWALHPTSERTLMLHGAAGKGKSAIVHTIARELQSEGLAVTPFFAFNRSVPDRSSSQLIPSWAKHLETSPSTTKQAQLQHKPGLANVVDDVANAAQTLFECAALLCRELTARQATSAVARTEFLRRLKETPGMSLYDSYRAILAMHFNKEDTEMVKLFRRVMAWVLLVRSPQSHRVFNAFGTALLPPYQQPDVDKVLHWLGSLLSGNTSEEDPIPPPHTSLRDFLLDVTKSGVFSVDLGPHSQEDLSWACLKIMNTGLQFNLCRLPTSFALNEQVEYLPQRVKNYISPRLSYACLATAYYLRSTQGPAVSIWSRLITEILGACVVLYMNTSLAVLLATVLASFHYKDGTLSAISRALLLAVNPLHPVEPLFLTTRFCMGTSRDGPGAILLLFLDWTTILGDEQLKMTVEDYMKFEKRFGDGCRLSAPQVYISGLLFCPKDSIVWERVPLISCGLPRSPW
ncbi:hypothetical protein C8J57DRAFT_1256646 [Mycena rebaudengoi]|nr:hypothetical protein C8J57DRAFT_1256646 [Mycena rebaudengoi]